MQIQALDQDPFDGVVAVRAVVVGAATGGDGPLAREFLEVSDDRLDGPQHAQRVLVEDAADVIQHVGVDRGGAVLPVGAAALAELGAVLGQVTRERAARALAPTRVRGDPDVVRVHAGAEVDPDAAPGPTFVTQFELGPAAALTGCAGARRTRRRGSLASAVQGAAQVTTTDRTPPPRTPPPLMRVGPSTYEHALFSLLRLCPPRELKRFIRHHYSDLLPSIRTGSSERITDSFLASFRNRYGTDGHPKLLDQLFLTFPERSDQLCEIAAACLPPSGATRYRERAAQMKGPVAALNKGLKTEAKRDQRRAVWGGVLIAAASMCTTLVIGSTLHVAMDYCSTQVEGLQSAAESHLTDLRANLGSAQKEREALEGLLNACNERSEDANACAGWQQALERSDELVHHLQGEIKTYASVSKIATDVKERRRAAQRPSCAEQDGEWRREQKKAVDAVLAELRELKTEQKRLEEEKKRLDRMLQNERDQLADEAERERLLAEKAELNRQIAENEQKQKEQSKP